MTNDEPIPANTELVAYVQPDDEKKEKKTTKTVTWTTVNTPKAAAKKS